MTVISFFTSSWKEGQALSEVRITVSKHPHGTAFTLSFRPLVLIILAASFKPVAFSSHLWTWPKRPLPKKRTRLRLCPHQNLAFVTANKMRQLPQAFLLLSWMSKPVSASLVANKLLQQCQRVVCGSLDQNLLGVEIYVSQLYPRPTESGIGDEAPGSAFHISWVIHMHPKIWEPLLWRN